MRFGLGWMRRDGILERRRVRGMIDEKRRVMKGRKR